jgi:hypothetical protein
MRMQCLSLSCVLALVALSGCVLAVEHTHQPFEGTLTFDWSVDGTTDPSECRQGDAITFNVQIETRSGSFVDEFEADCEDFETSIDLPAGRYQANAVLLDARDDERTTQVATDPFTVLEGDEVVVDIDFPARSFY